VGKKSFSGGSLGGTWDAPQLRGGKNRRKVELSAGCNGGGKAKGERKVDQWEMGGVAT